jgi:hypothetical protein
MIMKTSKCFIIIAAILFLAGSVRPGPAFALASTSSVPLGSPTYDYLDSLAGMGLITSDAKDSRPCSMVEVSRLVLEAAKNIALQETASHAFAMELVTRIRQILPHEGEHSDSVPRKPLFEVNLSAKVLNQYVGDTGVVNYNRPVLQNDLTITHVSSGVYLDIWQSISLSRSGVSSNYGNELEYFIGWSGEIFGIGADAGIGYFDLITLFNMPKGDVIQPYIELNKKAELGGHHTLIPYVRVEYGIPAKGNAKEFKGLYVYNGLKHGWQITEYISVNQKAVIIFDDGAYGADRAWVGAYEISSSYRIIEWLAFDLSGKVIAPFTKTTDGRKAQFIGSSGFSVTF